MAATALPNPFAGASSGEQPSRIADAALVTATALLSFAPIAILGPAIGWPASLRAPAAQQLAALLEAPGAVAAGYGVYLLYSILVLPVMVLVARRVFGTLAHPLAQLVVVFAALSVLARSIIARQSLPAWLGGLGLLSAALLAGMFLPAVGIAVQVPIAAAASLVSVWMLAFGVWVAIGKRAA